LKQIKDALQSSYKQVVYFLNTFFKNMINRKFEDAVEMINLSEMLLRVSEETFGKVGVKRGKFQKILHNHGKMIAELIVGLKSKRTVNKNVRTEERVVLEHYLRVVRVFGPDQLYLLNIGIVEVLTRKELDHSHIRYFITKIVLGGIREGSYDFYHLGLSLARSLLFCGQLNSCLGFREAEMDPSISSGIAKHTIVEFFGLVKDKFKRVVIKKMLLFIRSMVQNTHFVEIFKLTIVELQAHELNQLLMLFTELYRILTLITSEDGKVLQVRDALLAQLTGLFPLDLKLVLFWPLLPNQHLYLQLAEQLEEHAPGKTQFERLGELLNVVPEEITFEWVRFARECLKRGNRPSGELVAGVLGLVDLEGQLGTFAQLIC
jgi:hypothetical protein